MNSHTERYRSGHNEAVLKTVCPKGRVGSNPTLSVSKTVINFIRYKNQPAEVPKRLKGLPWKGSRSLIAARGFKSLLLRLKLLQRLFLKKLKKLLTNINKYVKLIWLLKKQQTRTLIIEQQPSLKIQNKFSERTLLNE